MKMADFWKEWHDLPEGSGYPLWGWVHILSICVTGVAIICLLFLYTRLGTKQKDRVIRGLPVLMAVLEICKDLVLIHSHRFTVGYLPLHFCSLGIFLFMFYAWGGKKCKQISGEIAFTMIMPGSVAALLFPDWTVYYPPFNFMNLYSYIWHGLLVIYPAMLMIDHRIKPSIRHIHYDLIFIICILPPIYVFDKAFDCNYLFVNWPVPDSPLSWIASVTGDQGYLAGYAVLVIFVLLVIYGLYHLIGWISNKKMIGGNYETDTRSPIER